MNIIVVGCGKVGLSLVEQLNNEGHDITVIDTDPAALEAAQAQDVQVLGGNGTSFRIQQEAGIEKADLLIAVTDQDEVNLLSCLIAGKNSQCRTVARVRSPEYFEEINYIRECMGTSLIINPEYATALEIDHLIRIPSAMEVDTFAKGRIELLKLQVPEKSVLHEMSLQAFSQRFDRNILVCILERQGEVVIPNGETVLRSGDNLYVIIPPKEIRRFCNVAGLPVRAIRNVLIAGGSRIAYYLARRLIANGISVKIIEADRERCEELSEQLPEADIIYGDATEYDLLLEEDLPNMDAFVALTSSDEENIFLSLYANKVAPRCKQITKNSRVPLRELMEDMPVGSLVAPKLITAEYISKFVRSQANSEHSAVEALYQLVDGKVEALEFLVKEKSAVTGIPLSRLKLKKNLLIACIVRNDRIITPGGSDTIEPGDAVVVITTQHNLEDIRDILLTPPRKSA